MLLLRLLKYCNRERREGKSIAGPTKIFSHFSPLGGSGRNGMSVRVLRRKNLQWPSEFVQKYNSVWVFPYWLLLCQRVHGEEATDRARRGNIFCRAPLAAPPPLHWKANKRAWRTSSCAKITAGNLTGWLRISCARCCLGIGERPSTSRLAIQMLIHFHFLASAKSCNLAWQKKVM